MPPETNVEYRTSTNFPVLHTEFQDFLPGQVPGKSLVIYEPKQPVLNELYPECIFVRIQDSETVSLYATSEHSLGRLLSAPKNVMGYYFGVIQNGQESRVTKRSCPQGGFRNDLPLWVVKDGKVINQSPNPIFYSRMSISSKTGIALIPVISGYSQHSGLIFCDQSDLSKPEVQNFLKEILGGTKRLDLKEIQMDIPVLAEAVKA